MGFAGADLGASGPCLIQERQLDLGPTVGGTGRSNSEAQTVE